MDAAEPQSNVTPIAAGKPADPYAKSYVGRREIIETARKREQHLLQRFTKVLMDEKDKLNGMTRLLGVIAERYPDIVVTHSELESMHPGRMYIIDDQAVATWSLKLRDDASKPVELSVVPEFVPDEALNHEEMAKDGVKELRFNDLG